MAARDPKRKLRLGDMLQEYGLVSDEQIQEALTYGREKGLKIGNALIELGFVTQDQINQLLEFQLGIPFVNLRDIQIDPECIKLVPEAIVKKYTLIPIKTDGYFMEVVMSDPLNIIAVDDVSLTTNMQVIPKLGSEEQINAQIDMHYGQEQAMQAAEQFRKELSIDEGEEEADDEALKNAPIVKLVNSILEQAVHHRTSDVHIEPLEYSVRVRFRIDGMLKEMMKHDISLLPAIVTRLKIMGGMDISEKRKPQDGRIPIIVDRKEFDIRVSILPTVDGEKIVMRLTSKEGLTKPKSDLGMNEYDLMMFDKLLSNTNGVILVTGPTGSGKSTTLYTALSELNQDDVNIITVEDPVEANISGINQVQTNNKAGLTFASALRSILRQDPDIIMIGEIRDNETAGIAVKAAITGHLVVSTLHTNSAPSTISRIIDMGLESYLVSEAVVGIIAQRLMRRLCPKCREEYQVEDHERTLLGLNESESMTLYRHVGCPQCSETGYRGRIGIYEIMIISPRIRLLINKGATADELKDQAVLEGMRTLKASAIELVKEGITTVDELLRVAYENE